MDEKLILSLLKTQVKIRRTGSYFHFAPGHILSYKSPNFNLQIIYDDSFLSHKYD